MCFSAAILSLPDELLDTVDKKNVTCDEVSKYVVVKTKTPYHNDRGRSRVSVASPGRLAAVLLVTSVPVRQGEFSFSRLHNRASISYSVTQT